MKKKGFMLIELLAVIIILAVIALIATPVVLNVVENARREANKNSVYGIMDSAKLYYAESLLDSSKKNNINGTTNLINEISISGKRPESGVLYINNKGETALAVVYGNICYKKNFTETDLTESEDTENCSLDVEETPIIPSGPSVPEVSYKCIRADLNTLHTETCNQTDTTYYCSAAGYKNSTIKYGNEEVTSGNLNSGDAFDCDVNGDGTYDPITERFYYVSDLYDTTNKEFDSEYAVLIYYNNTSIDNTGNVVPDNTSISLISYDSNNTNYNGPLTAMTKLPTKEQWKNIQLKDMKRAIVNSKGVGSVKNGNYILPTDFSYTNETGVEYVGRLLTTQELAVACDSKFTTQGIMDKCNYLLENTKYSNSSYGNDGHWLETPDASFNYGSLGISGKLRAVHGHQSNTNGQIGVRPVIEVLKTNIEIEF